MDAWSSDAFRALGHNKIGAKPIRVFNSKSTTDKGSTYIIISNAPKDGIPYSYFMPATFVTYTRSFSFQ